MRILPFQAVYPNFEYISSPDSFFGNVKYDYPDYKKSGFFTKAPQEALYIYEIKTVSRDYTGLIACSDIRDYEEENIKRHENTLPSKEQQQMHLMLSRNAILKPVLLTYKGVDALNKLINEYKNSFDPYYATHFQEENATHSIWEVSDGKRIQQIQKLFKKHVPITYIADGHHRCSTTALMHERLKKKKSGKDYSRLLSAFFPADELEVHDYNRVVDGLDDLTLTTFMARISKLFDIDILDEPTKPSKKHEIVMFVNREWFKLTWKKKYLKVCPEMKVLLDASLLDQLVLKEILGIKDTRTDTRIKYIEGPKGLDEIRGKAIKNERRLAFMLYPASLNDLITVADAGQTMPPKSTWFEPRMKNGVIVQEYEK